MKGDTMPRTKAENVVLEILRSADGEWTGKTRLSKAFYFAHLFYASEQPGLLTDWPLARMAEGPAIHDSDKLFGQLTRAGLLVIERVHEGPYPEYRYRLADREKEMLALPEDARKAIQKAVLYCRDKTASQLSALTHEQSRSWKLGKDGDLLDIYIDLIPDEEYTERQAEIDRLASQLPAILGKKRKRETGQPGKRRKHEAAG
jgi:hypothetical protein